MGLRPYGLYRDGGCCAWNAQSMTPKTGRAPDNKPSKTLSSQADARQLEQRLTCSLERRCGDLLRWPLCKRHSWMTTLFGLFYSGKVHILFSGSSQTVIWQVLIDIMWVSGTQLNKQNASITQILLMPCACSPFFIVCAGFVMDGFTIFMNTEMVF